MTGFATTGFATGSDVTGFAVTGSDVTGFAVTGHAGTVALVAQPTPTPDDPGGRGEDFGKSAPVGLVVIIVFFIAVFFLVRSMNKHLRRVPESFDPPAPPPGDGAKPSDGRPD